MIRKLMIASFSLFICLYALERYAQQQPLERIQHILELENQTLRVVDGVPVWRSKGAKSEARSEPACLASGNGQPDVIILGDSILFGVRLPAENSLGPVLQEQLLERHGRSSCVINLSEPGFTFSNQEVVLREALEKYKPKAVILEMWFNSTNHFVAVDGMAYNFGVLAKDINGLPDLGLPASVNHVLFHNTALWKHISLGLASETSMPLSTEWERFVAEKLEPLATSLAAQDIDLILVYATSLDAPFSAERPTEDMAYGIVQEWSKKHNIPNLLFSEVFADEDVASVAMDRCCHINEYGTKLVSSQLAPIVFDVLNKGVD